MKILPVSDGPGLCGWDKGYGCAAYESRIEHSQRAGDLPPLMATVVDDERAVILGKLLYRDCEVRRRVEAFFAGAIAVQVPIQKYPD